MGENGFSSSSSTTIRPGRLDPVEGEPEKERAYAVYIITVLHSGICIRIHAQRRPEDLSELAETCGEG